MAAQENPRKRGLHLETPLVNQKFALFFHLGIPIQILVYLYLLPLFLSLYRIHPCRKCTICCNSVSGSICKERRFVIVCSFGLVHLLTVTLHLLFKTSQMIVTKTELNFNLIYFCSQSTFKASDVTILANIFLNF